LGETVQTSMSAPSNGLPPEREKSFTGFLKIRATGFNE